MSGAKRIVWPQFPRYTDPLRYWSSFAPDRTALVDRARGTRQTYAEFNAAADKWAALLRDMRVGKGQRVAVVAGNRHEVAELFFGCIRVGAALVPLNWRLAPAELSAILKHSQSSLVVGETRFRESIGKTMDAGANPAWLDLDVEAPSQLAKATRREADVETGADDAVLILYTSGSTGKPKGVIVPHRQVLYNAIATTTAWELGHTDIAPVSTPFFHTGGWNVFATPLWYRGGTVVLFDQFDPASFIDGLAEEGCTVALTVPTQLIMMYGSHAWGRDLPALRFFISGGAPCPASLMQRVRAAGYTLREGYGLTECGPNCFAMSSEESLVNPGKVGRPVPFLEMRLVKDDGSESSLNEPGELQLRGPQMFGGYLHDSERTAEALTDDGWLRTGDLAMRDEAGLFSICGRKKEMYISGGENVFPAEVESALASHPAIAEVVVVGAPHQLWGETGCAFVVARSSSEEISGEAIIAFARQHLAGYKVPRTIFIVGELPRLGSGKPDRRELASRAAAAVSSPGVTA
ncbi:MAG TPA: AMP-binding protein [Gemmatimonadaceae bacterium]|nr:AMP-binding protein [Gemmatimonadaceae bacterium]